MTRPRMTLPKQPGLQSRRNKNVTAVTFLRRYENPPSAGDFHI